MKKGFFTLIELHAYKTPTGTMRSPGQMKSPAKTGSMADSKMSTWSNGAANELTLDFRHSNNSKANAAYCDEHVEKLRMPPEHTDIQKAYVSPFYANYSKGDPIYKKIWLEMVRKNMTRTFFFLLFLVCLPLTAAEFTVPFLAKSPDIDGTLVSGEWDGAMAISGAGRTIDARRTTLWLGFDDRNLYVAMQTEAPPRGSLVASRQGHVIHDDSLEMWFAPPAALRTLEATKFGYFQLIVNSRDRVYACHHNPGYGLPARDWQSNAAIKSSVGPQGWTLEMAFPLTSFGIAGSAEGDWRILAVRNFRTSPSYQAPMTDVGGFMDSNSYSIFHLAKGALAVQQLYAKGSRIPLLFRITNTGEQPALARMTLHLGEGDQKKGFGRDTEIHPGRTGKMDFTEQCDTENSNYRLFLQTTGWWREFNWRPPELPIWRNTESYQTMACRFDGERPAIEYTTFAEAKAKLSPDKPLNSVRGPSAALSSLDLTGHTLTFSNVKLNTPGAVAFWMRVQTPLASGKEYRRFCATVFTPKGYLFFQEQHQGGLLLGVQYFEPVNQKPSLVFAKRRPTPGEWMHVAMNFSPNNVELFLNGIKRATLNHGLGIDFAKVGDLLMSDAAFTALATYSRALTNEEILGMAQGEKPITGTLGWYQSLEKVVADLVLDCQAVPDQRLQLQIRDPHDAVAAELPIDFSKAPSHDDGTSRLAVLHTTLELPRRLAEGKYSFFLARPGSENPLLERSFEVRRYPWLHNTIGLSERLLPGFTPLRRNGQTLSAVLRDIVLADNGLPAQVTALGKPVLARPVTLVAESSGKACAWHSPPLTFTRETPTAIEATAQMECEALRIAAAIRMEQDGLLRYDWTLARGTGPLPSRLYIDIPVHKEIAKLFHAVGEGLRNNPADEIPRGTGLIFSSRSIQQTNFNNFIPYLWVGDDDRGICYVADWDMGWLHSKERSAVELHREPDGTVTIRLNLRNAAEQPTRTITFALQASPVKPMPKGWRGWRDSYTLKATQISRCLYSQPYWGSYYGWLARYPAFGDFGYWDKLIGAMRTGEIDQKYVSDWIERVLKAAGTPDAPRISGTPQERRKFVTTHTQAAFNLVAGLHKHRDHAVLYPYTCNNDSPAGLPEYSVMRDEWGSGLLHNNSYIDYAIYYLDKMLQSGFRGIYNDNVFFSSCRSWATDNGWIDDTGTVHPSLGLWRSREYFRRQACTMLERGVTPWITAHHTNTNVLPAIGYATNSMGMEWKYGINDFQERFSSGYIRAVCSGRQGGFYPTILDGIVGAKDAQTRNWATRTMLASLLPHEVQPTCPRGSDYRLIISTLDTLYDFGTWQEDTKVFHFWDETSSVKCSDSELKQVTYQRGKELLTFVGSFANQTRTAEMEYGQALDNATNAENGQLLKVIGSRVSFPLGKHDFIMIRATLKN